MTVKEITDAWENELAALINKGLTTVILMPKRDTTGSGIRYSAKPQEQVTPATHIMHASRPFIFDVRQLPKTFHGFELDIGASDDQMPEEFRMEDLEELVSYSVVYSEQKILAYAEEHALEICEQLNDYTLKLKDICDMIANGDFERHKEMLKQLPLREMGEEP